MGNARRVQSLDLLPHPLEELVVDALDGHVVEGMPTHALLDDEHLAARAARRQLDVRHAHAGLGGHESEQGFVLR